MRFMAGDFLMSLVKAVLFQVLWLFGYRETLVLGNFGSRELWFLGTLAPWRLGLLVHESVLAPWNLLTLGAEAPWYFGTFRFLVLDSIAEFDSRYRCVRFGTKVLDRFF
jgi:hypothetical protein